MRTVKMMAVLLPLMAGGCVHSAMDLAALPARSVDKAVDWSTTSRQEAYRNRRMAEERAYNRHVQHEADKHGWVYFAPVPSGRMERP